MIEIKLPDGNIMKVKQGSTPYEVALQIGEGLARACLGAVIKTNSDEVLIDNHTPIKENATIRIITHKDEESLDIIRHSAAHILAQAVQELFPYAKPTIGPSTENGFYYDFDHEPFSEEDLKKIETKMKELIDKDQKITREEISKEKALELFRDNPFKVELISELEDNTITIYHQDKWFDLCRGPHVMSTKMLKAVKIDKSTGAYWRGDASNKQLQRIYGFAFHDKKELNTYLHKLEEAKKRDHRKLGKELDLFSFHPEAPGHPFWHPKGIIIYNELVNLARKENAKRGYNEVRTPTIMNEILWKTSGHWDNFKENMYFTKVDKENYAVKPMNCPGGLLIFKTRTHSYRELPLKNAEFGYVHRHEMSGVLSGLFRVRGFTQDDAHSFCTPEQIQSEVVEMVEYAKKIYSTFGFEEYTIYIATKPEKAIGDDSVWEIATDALMDALDNVGMEYKIKPGEGAFYGPKIEFNIKDAIGRNWQCGTIQVDFSMPARFDATYEGNDGNKHNPVMIHRAIFGSIERFLGILVEHYAGKFPLWLNPNQAIILPVSDKFLGFSKEVLNTLKESGFRISLDDSANSISKKIRNAQLEKYNYMIVIGEKEVESKTITVRNRDGANESGLELKDFIIKMNDIVARKSDEL